MKVLASETWYPCNFLSDLWTLMAVSLKDEPVLNVTSLSCKTNFIILYCYFFIVLKNNSVNNSLIVISVSLFIKVIRSPNEMTLWFRLDQRETISFNMHRIDDQNVSLDVLLRNGDSTFSLLNGRASSCLYVRVSLWDDGMMNDLKLQIISKEIIYGGGVLFFFLVCHSILFKLKINISSIFRLFEITQH